MWVLCQAAMFMKTTVNEIIRYGFVGVLSNLVGYVIYLALTNYYSAPKVTATLLYAVGAMVGFMGNRSFTFRSNDRLVGTGVRYIFVYFLGYLLNIWLLFYYSDRLGYRHEWVQAAAIFVVAAFLFIAMKLFVFRGVENR